MSHPPSTSSFRRRLRRVGGTLIAAPVTLAGLVVISGAPAHAEDVAPAIRPFIKDAGSIVGGDEIKEAAWGATYLGYTINGSPNAAKTELELQTELCGPDAEGTASAFVPASANPSQRGSAERPKSALQTPPWETFGWLGSEAPYAVFGAIGSSFPLATRAYVEAALAGDPSAAPVPVAKAFPANSLISLVVYCTKGVDPVAGAFAQPLTDADGYVISTWVTFRTVASTTDTSQTSAGFKIVSDKVVPVASLNAQWAAGVGTLTASLKGEDGAALTDATGTVHFYRGTGGARTEVGTAPVTATGTASLPLAGLVAAGGTAPFDAEYVPDEAASKRYERVTSGRYTVIAPENAAATTTTLGVTGDLVAGATQTLSATVTPSGAAGTVTFRDGSTELGSAPVASGRASITRALTLGAHNLTAVFDATDDAAFLGSQSTAQTVTIAPKPPTQVSPGLAASAASAIYGQPSVVRVTAVAGTTGTVTLSEGGRTIGSAALSGGGASFALGDTALSPGAHQLTVSYPGDAGHTPASAAVTVHVAKGSTKIAAKVATKKVMRKKTAAMVAVTVKGTGFTPAGKVSVLLGKKKVGTATLKNGKATVKLKKFAKAGTVKLTVTYAESTTGKASSTKLTVKVRSR